MRVLNLYAGLGGNRKLWGQDVKVTAVELNQTIARFYKDRYPNDKVITEDAHEYLLNNYKNFDFIWSSVNCPTHSRARFWSSKGGTTNPVFPDMKLYEEILFLKHYFDGNWIVENVVPYYTPMINPTVKIGRHLIWSNFRIPKIEVPEADINNGNIEEWQRVHGICIDGYKFDIRKDKILRNCVHPELGLHIMNCVRNVFERKGTKQIQINFNQ